MSGPELDPMDYSLNSVQVTQPHIQHYFNIAYVASFFVILIMIYI